MKKLLVILILIVMLFTLSGCVTRGNRIITGIDVQTFNYAFVKLGNDDIVSGNVAQWRDYDNSDVVQVLIDGKYYLTHYSNVVLIADPELGDLNYANTNWIIDLSGQRFE